MTEFLGAGTIFDWTQPSYNASCHDSMRSQDYYWCFVFGRLLVRVESWDSVVCVETRLQASYSGVRMSLGEKIFLYSHMSRQALETTQTPVQLILESFAGIIAAGA